MESEVILNKYGRCVVPTNKLLWTFQAGKWKPSTRDVFVFIDPSRDWAGEPFTLKTKSELMLVAPFDVIPGSFQPVSCLPELHQDVTGQPLRFESKMVSFKADYNARRPLLDALDKLGIDGWIHPVEGSLYHMELCITKAATKVSVARKTSTLDSKLTILPGSRAAWLLSATPRDLRHWKSIHREQLRYDERSWTPLDDLMMRR